MRKSIIERKTTETEILIEVDIDGKGKAVIETRINFLNHMLELFSKFGLFDLTIKAHGDLKVDQHHTVEDIGIALGKAFEKALGNKKGINRSGYFVMPMDEALAIVAVDIGGRSFLSYEAEFSKEKIGDLDSELIQDFFQAFADNLKCNLHVKVASGRSDHHKAEAIFKGFGKSMKMACSKDPRAIEDIPSTKGII